MLPVDHQREALAAVERDTGKPVILAAESKLPNEALIRVAAESSPAHVLKYRTSSEPELPYLVCFQCGIALRATLAPRDERFNVVSTPDTYSAVRRLVDERNPAWRGSLPEHAIADYVRMITDGLGTQLRSMPVGIRVDRLIHDRQPELRQQQEVVARRQLSENAAILAPSVRANAPELIFRASAGINAAFAIFWAGLWGIDTPMVPYQLAGFVETGERLMSLLEATPADRMHDRQLVESWSRSLGIDHLYGIGPVGL